MRHTKGIGDTMHPLDNLCTSIDFIIGTLYFEHKITYCKAIQCLIHPILNTISANMVHTIFWDKVVSVFLIFLVVHVSFKMWVLRMSVIPHYLRLMVYTSTTTSQQSALEPYQFQHKQQRFLSEECHTQWVDWNL